MKIGSMIAPLVILDGVLNRVQAMHGDGVELPPLDLLADVTVAFRQVFLVLVDIELHSGRNDNFGVLRHARPRGCYC